VVVVALPQNFFIIWRWGFRTLPSRFEPSLTPIAWLVLWSFVFFIESSLKGLTFSIDSSQQSLFLCEVLVGDIIRHNSFHLLATIGKSSDQIFVVIFWYFDRLSVSGSCKLFHNNLTKFKRCVSSRGRRNRRNFILCFFWDCLPIRFIRISLGPYCRDVCLVIWELFPSC
jgi:hypothetical protein